MTFDEAHARIEAALGPDFRVHLVRGTRTRLWWAVATHRTARDPDGNTYDWAEKLGSYLTAPSVDRFVAEVCAGLPGLGRRLPEGEAPAPP